MSLKTWALALGLAATSLCAPVARAADHNDGSFADASTDIADLYAWMNSTATAVNMVMTVNPSADKTTTKFSSTSLYVFHVMSKASFSDTGVYPEYTVVCSFNSAAIQLVQCWGGDSEYVTGDPNTGTGLVSATGKLRVFAGPRNDPFYFNLNGFNSAVTTIKGLLTPTNRDTPGCPTVAAAGTTSVKNSLSMNPADTYIGKNVLALVVTLDKTLVTTPQRQTITVYGSTNKPVP
jgi:hypothetical protein